MLETVCSKIYSHVGQPVALNGEKQQIPEFPSAIIDGVTDITQISHLPRELYTGRISINGINQP
jgi:hypothetical protein